MDDKKQANECQKDLEQGGEEHTASYSKPLLQALIKETNLAKSDGVFTWVTEWLGYLPFGAYQWVTIDDEDKNIDVSERPRYNDNISNKFNFDWDIKDLVRLNELGLLIKLSEKNPEKFNTIIKYKLNFDKIAQIADNA